MCYNYVINIHGGSTVKENTTSNVLKYFAFVLADIGFAVFFVICMNDGPSGKGTPLTVLGVFAALLYPIVRGIVSYKVLRNIWLPNLIFSVEIYFIPTLLIGDFSGLISPSGLIFAVIIFCIPTVASAITSAVTRSQKDEE